MALGGKLAAQPSNGVQDRDGPCRATPSEVGSLSDTKEGRDRGRPGTSTNAIPSRPCLLDLFCGAGGAAMGYHRAGFEVVGVDIAPQPNYPFKFVQEDALDYLLGRGDWKFSIFDAIHASPPCQRWLGVPGALGEADYPDLIAPTRELLKSTGLPYVIENVPGAPLEDGFVLCGSTFGLPVVRHRRFEVWPQIGLVPSTCHQGSEHVLPVLWPWMTLEESHDAIPPAYTELVGESLLAHIGQEVAA